MIDNGLTIPPWSGRRAQAELEWVRKSYGPRGKLATDKVHGDPCVICHQRLNYGARGTSDSLSVQHMKSRKLYPQLTWSRENFRPSHLSCNQSAGTGPVTGLGLTSQ